MKGVFITGTDTGVGKTIVSAVIIRALIKEGIKVGAMKPLETGCGRTLVPADGLFLKEMAEMDDPIDVIAPVCFEQPLAPMAAADIENKTVDLESIRRAYKVLSQKYDFMVVEGVGGLLVPIMRQPSSAARQPSPYFVGDLIRDLDLPVIIVASPGLGTINHTLLTVNQALSAGLKVSGVIISQAASSDNTISAKTNPDVLRELCPVPVLGIVPHMDKINRENVESVVPVVLEWLLSGWPFSDFRAIR